MIGADGLGEAGKAVFAQQAIEQAEYNQKMKFAKERQLEHMRGMRCVIHKSSKIKFGDKSNRD